MSKHKPFTRPTAQTLLAFVITAGLCAGIVGITVLNRVSVETLKMEQLITEKSVKAIQEISYLLYKTQTLALILRQNHGEIGDFDMVAAGIVDDPVILNILLAPNGKVSHVYPLEGNEAVIGLDFFAEGRGNAEAVMAAETGQLVFGGPFDLIQGGQALVGRLPVYLSTSGDDSRFWGLVSVTLRYPQVLDRVGLNELLPQGFAYEVWRISPDTGERQVIAYSGHEYSPHTRYIDKRVSILNADWYFRILPVRAWYEYAETWLLIVLGLCVSLLVGLIMHNNSQLHRLKGEFEVLSQTDPLTGISNRRHFFALAALQCSRSQRLMSQSFLIVFDLDYFKAINDKHGHPVGDQALATVAARVQNAIRPYDIFARYGGEEFILLASDLSESDMMKLVERIRLSISDPLFEIDGIQLTITASFGVARLTPVNDLDTAIQHADRALYMAKEDGRNKTVLYEENPEA